MRTEHLQYLMAITDGQTINAVSEALHISPQGLSSAIASLESELNCPLLVRTKRGVYLTEEGKRVVALSKSFFTELASLSDSPYALSGSLVILATSGNINYLLADRIARFLKENPNVSIDFRYTDHTSCIDAVRSGQIEVAFVSYTTFRSQKLAHAQVIDESGLLFTPIATAYACIECHKDLAKGIKKNSLLEGVTIDHLILPQEKALIYAENEQLRQMMHLHPKKISCEPNDKLYYQLLLNKLGHGWGVLSHHQSDLARSQMLVQIPLSRDIQTSFGFIERKNVSRSALVNRLIDTITY